jgi:propionyl-CoA synthetase
MSRQRETYRSWQQDPTAFWQEAAGAISWDRAPTIVCDTAESASGCWFTDGQLNACYNAVDRHVEQGRGRQVAIVHVSAMTGQTVAITYDELQHEVSRLAGALQTAGVQCGDRVIIYMPMVPQAVFAMLACARIGAIHSVVFGGFAARELAVRIDDAEPKLILAASCGLEPGRVVDYFGLLQRALQLAEHAPRACVVLQREQSPAALTSGYVDWDEFIAGAEPVAPLAMKSTDPLYILYTSGTTGKPKGVLRDTGGYLVALSWSMRYIYNTQAGECFWAASDIGWVVGHSYIVYGPLLAGCTTILFEGKPVGTPDAGTFWRIIEEHAVKTLFTAPTALRAIKREDPQGHFVKESDLSSLKAVFLAGERADPDTVYWAAEQLTVPVIDHWWQTETGWPIVANCLGLGDPLPIKAGSASLPVPGFEVCVVDDTGQILPAGRQGDLVIRLPLPPGCLPALWNDPVGFQAAYFTVHPGWYTSGDGGHIDDDGYVYVMGRVDDVINVAGHRLSTGELEQSLAGHPAVAECAVIGIADGLKGTVPMGLVVLKSGVSRDASSLIRELVNKVREDVGPVASFHRCHIVSRLPKTRSGKVLRATMRSMAAGRDVPVPPTIEDPSVLQELEGLLSAHVRES